MDTVNIKINGQDIVAKKGSTILEVARESGIYIPTLCYIKELNPKANCRMCIVEIEGYDTFKPACATKVREGMVIQTETEPIRKARKTILELLLAHHAVDCHHCMRIGSSKCDDLDPYFCEMCFFCDCERDGFCEQQSLAREYKVDHLPYTLRPNEYKIDDSMGSIIRDPNKCIKCMRCLDICSRVQTVSNLCKINRGTEIMVAPIDNKKMSESNCVQCGRCVDVCPTGAFFVKEHIDEVLYHTHEYKTITVAQISEDIIPEFTRISKDKRNINLKYIIDGLYKIGFDYVVSDEMAISISEKSGIKALEENSQKDTIIITNSPASIRFLCKNYPKLKNILVTYPSVQQVFGKYIKDEFAKEKEINADCIYTVNVSNNNENAGEVQEFNSVDYTINARELYRIFIRTGAETAYRNPHEPYQLKNIEINHEPLFATSSWKIDSNITETSITIKGKEEKVAIAHTLGQSRQLLEDIKSGCCKYKVIRLNA